MALVSPLCCWVLGLEIQHAEGNDFGPVVLHLRLLGPDAHGTPDLLLHFQRVVRFGGHPSFPNNLVLGAAMRTRNLSVDFYKIHEDPN